MERMTHEMSQRIDQATAQELYLGLFCLERIRARDKGFDLVMGPDGEFIYRSMHQPPVANHG